MSQSQWEAADGHELEFIEGVGLAVFGQTTLNRGLGPGPQRVRRTRFPSPKRGNLPAPLRAFRGGLARTSARRAT